jgi:hypothetical protein
MKRFQLLYVTKNKPDEMKAKGCVYTCRHGGYKTFISTVVAESEEDKYNNI